MLLGPRFLPDTDPLGVDPYSVRLAAVTVALLALVAAVPRLRPALPVQVAVAAVVLPFVVWQSASWVLDKVAPHVPARLGSWLVQGRPAFLLAQVGYLTAAILLCVAGARLAGTSWARWLRLRVDGRAVSATVATVVVMCVAFLAVPATLVGRLAVPLAVLSRDLPLLGPAYVLQAAAQEIAFRGALLRTLERTGPPWAANLGQSLLFGLAHIAVQYEGPTDSIIPVTVVLGLALGWVTQRTGSIWPAVVAHAVLEVGQAYGVLPGLYGL